MHNKINQYIFVILYIINTYYMDKYIVITIIFYSYHVVNNFLMIELQFC